MIKSGKTAAGSQRWKCRQCQASSTARRTDQNKRAIFTRFLTYVCGTHSHTDIAGTQARSQRRAWAWCWAIPTPSRTVTAEVYEEVFIDGIYLPYDWCLLIARSPAHVIAWQWARRENSTAYQALLQDVAPPDLVATDGGAGAGKALGQIWPGTKVQRCLVHVHRNNLADLTRRPNTIPGRTLLTLSRRLLDISTRQEAAQWMGLLVEFHATYATYLTQRTYAVDVPQWQRRPGRTWWYTHNRDRRVYQRLSTLAADGSLFAFLDFDPPRERTTNPVESINAGIRELVHAHRGMSEDHMITMIDWYLYTRTENPLTPVQILTQWEAEECPERHLIPKKKPKPSRHEETGIPPHYDNHTTPEEGLWARKGWAGRPQ